MLIDSTPTLEPNARILTPLLAALTALSIDMSLPAMPQLQQTFHVGVSSAQLTLSVFLLGFALGQLICGPVSDRRGRRPVLLAGLGLFALAGYLVGVFAAFAGRHGGRVRGPHSAGLRLCGLAQRACG